jgi:[ribosomal protein S5]-alanine N-acetyltransferase
MSKKRLIEADRIYMRHPDKTDGDEFIALMEQSKALHHPWVEPPLQQDHFEFYCEVAQSEQTDGFLICDKETEAIMGVINLNQIVYGVLCNASVGYYMGAPFAHGGYMHEALRAVLHYSFSEKRLHRIEANIQPHNHYSKRLVRKLRFRNEGFSPKYIYICGKWCDHERYAMTAEDYVQKLMR